LSSEANFFEAATAYDAWFDSPLGVACLASETRLLATAGGELAGKCIVEIGCGTGRFLFGMAADTRMAVGIDRDSAMLRVARQKAPLYATARCTWLQGDGSAIPFANDSFDLVFENTVLCSCPDPVPLLQEMVRVCKPGGTVLLGELNPSAPWQLWRRLKAHAGLGSFRSATWHSTSYVEIVLKELNCEVRWVGRAIFFPPFNVYDVFGWRGLFESLGQRLWPWAGAYYVLAALKAKSLASMRE
jgi:SAM-dependent methyltransferase